MERLFSTVRELSDPSAWSAGVEVARRAAIEEYRPGTPEERHFRVATGPKDSLASVSLSELNQSWQCDCGSSEDPCRHVIGTLIALRQGGIGDPTRRRLSSVGHVIHRFRREGRFLSFSRVIASGGREVPVVSTLEAAAPDVACSAEERRIDHVLPASRRAGILEPKDLRLLLRALSRVSVVELDGSPVTCSGDPVLASAVIVDDGDGYRLRREISAAHSEEFENGAILADSGLFALEDSALSADDLALLRGDGTHYPREEAVNLASRIVPALQGRIAVEIRTRRLPRARMVAPRAVLELSCDEPAEMLTVIPRIVYGDPEIARVEGRGLRLVSEREMPVRDPAQEGRLARLCSERLGVRPNEARVLSGAAAVAFVSRLQGWATTGRGLEAFTPREVLTPRVQGAGGDVAVELASSDGLVVPVGEALELQDRGEPFVRLMGMGWARLPVEFLSAHREALERILAAREATGAAACRGRQLADTQALCRDLMIGMPEYFRRLEAGLSQLSEIPRASLPADLAVDLRPYQQLGVNWLSFLRDHQLCGLLADDMGLGKTLQALCILSGRSLIVAPTSVIFSWQEEISRFRPALSVCLYHGSGRALDVAAQATLTTYSLLRSDADALHAVEWDTVVLDEAQMIRNPDSQVARAAHGLRARHKVSLSGTPIENSLDDLWSQFEFLQPGLLGTRAEFEARFRLPVERGDRARSAELRRTVSPFILRRLKRDVATELPPKTEVVLECELSPEERLHYDAILCAARVELDALDEGGAQKPLSILEALLRLRQACCHSGLLPGVVAQGSSKVSLLLDSLKESGLLGHRALVFSQWTSLLDLIEPGLRGAGISFLRIDGSTVDRAGIVAEFQQSSGPQVLLLSLKAGGLGLNLTAADHVYILDPWWNPAAEDQAADRAYRIGQENPVVVHRLVARDTVEERILTLQAAKRQLALTAVGERSELGLSVKDLRDLVFG